MKGAKQHIFFLLLTLLYLCGVAGCVDEQHPADCAAEEVEVLLKVRFNFATNNTRATDNGTLWERQVNTLRIFVFHEDGDVDETIYLSQGGGFTDDPLEVSTVIKEGNKTFLLIGNEPGYLTNDLEAIENLSELQQMQLTTHPWQYITGLPFVTLEQISIVKGEDEIVELSLRRAVAKTEIRLIKSADNYCQVELSKIEIIDTPEKSKLLPGSPFSDTSLLRTETENFSGLTLTSGDYTTAAYYLYERLTGTSDPARENIENAKANRATYIRLSLLIDNVLNTYDIPLFTQNSTPEIIYDIIRNTLYRLDILIHPYSLYVDYNIHAWDWDKNDDNNYDKDLGGGDNGSFYSIGLWIEGETWLVELPGTN